MRAFVAVDLPDELRTRINNGVEHIRTISGLSVVKPDRMHITLAFLGEVTEQKVDDLTVRLTRAAERTLPFELETGTPKRFGNRLVYLSLTGDTSDLRKLATRVVAAARRVGVDVGDRRFRPHITLARARNKMDLQQVVDAVEPIPPASWGVASFSLLRSYLGAEPRYEPLAEFPFSTTTLQA